MYFILDRLVGLDASCPKHTLFLKMTPPPQFHFMLIWKKMVKNALGHDRVRLVSKFPCFKDSKMFIILKWWKHSENCYENQQMCSIRLSYEPV
jgi:hypothetical protein